MKKSLSVALALSCAASAQMSAQSVQVFGQAVGASVVNFNALVLGAAGTALFAGFPGVTVSAGCFVANAFSSTNFGPANAVQASNTAAGGGSSCAGSTFNAVTLSFATPQNYFGLLGVTNSAAQAGLGLITLTGTNGSVNGATSTFGVGPATFVGFTDATGFTSVTIAGSGNGAFAVDDISFRAALVTPEPASMVLLGAGMAAVAAFARRKRSA